MNSERLENLLHRSHRLLLIAETGRRALIGLVLLVASGLIVLAIDATVGLTVWALIVFDAALIAVVLVSAVYLLVGLHRGRFAPRRLAVLIERRSGIDDNQLINAVDLAGSAGGFSMPLVEQAVAMGNDRAGTIAPQSAVDRRRLTSAARWAAGAVLVAVIAYVFLPQVFGAVVPRLLQPTADHPPFTLVTFDVRIEPQRVIHSRPARIHATLTGPNMPDQATLVFVDEPGAPKRQPMLRRFASGAAASAPADETAAQFEFQIDRAMRSRTFYIDTPHGRSRRYQMTVHMVPLVESARVDYGYPAYTEWDAASEALGGKGIDALQGTDVTVTVSSNVPLQAGTLTLQPTTEDEGGEPKVVMLTPDRADPQTASGNFAMQFSGAYTLALEGADGTTSDTTLTGELVCQTDEPPKVWFDQPPQQTLAAEGWPVDVIVVAEDDVGLDRVVLHHAMSEAIPTPMELSLVRESRTRAAAHYRFDLSALGAMPGDVIRYFATAYDNHPGGGQSSDTDTWIIEVVSMEEFVELARQQYRIEDLNDEMDRFQEQLRDLAARRQELVAELDALRQRIEDGERLTDAERWKMRQIERELADYAQQAQELAEEMNERAAQKQLYDFETPYYDVLRQTAEDLAAQAETAEAVRQASQTSRGEPSPAARSALAQAIERFADQTDPFGDEQEQMRQAMEYDLELLELAGRMMRQVARIQSVIERQRDLATRMATFADQDRIPAADQARADQLAEEQDEIRAELDDAMADLRAVAEVAQEALPKMSRGALEICQDIESLGVLDDQAEAQRAAVAAEGRQAFEAAEAAADKLESLLKDCQSASGQASDDLDGCLSLTRPALQNALQQMAQAMGAPSTGAQGSGASGQAGSASPIGLAGPRSVSAGGGGGERDAANQTYTFDGTELKTSDDVGPETVTPDSATGVSSAAGAFEGVPARFRHLAEAYFRRLAEEE